MLCLAQFPGCSCSRESPWTLVFVRNSSTDPGLQWSGGNSCLSQRRNKILVFHCCSGERNLLPPGGQDLLGRNQPTAPEETKSLLWPRSKHSHNSPRKTTPVQLPRGSESLSIWTLPCPKDCPEHRLAPGAASQEPGQARQALPRAGGALGLWPVQSTSTVSRAKVCEPRDTQGLSRSSKGSSASGLSCFEEKQLEVFTYQ